MLKLLSRSKSVKQTLKQKCPDPKTSWSYGISHCGGLSEKCVPQAPVFEHLVSSWCHGLERFRRCILHGGIVSMGWALRVYNHIPLSITFLFFFHGDGNSVSELLHNAMPCHHDGLLYIWNFEPKEINSFLSKLPWSKYFAQQQKGK